MSLPIQNILKYLIFCSLKRNIKKIKVIPLSNCLNNFFSSNRCILKTNTFYDKITEKYELFTMLI